MAGLSVTVRAERVSEVEAGLWCDTCLLPSRYRCLMALWIDGCGPRLEWFTRCEEGCNDGPEAAGG
jgi:hypothetical protein